MSTSKKLNRGLEQRLANMARRLNSAKDQAVDGFLKRHYPEQHALAHADNGRDRMKVAKWLSQNRFHFHHPPGITRAELRMDGKPVLEINFEWNGKELHARVRDLIDNPRPNDQTTTPMAPASEKGTNTASPGTVSP